MPPPGPPLTLLFWECKQMKFWRTIRRFEQLHAIPPWVWWTTDDFHLGRLRCCTVQGQTDCSRHQSPTWHTQLLYLHCQLILGGHLRTDFWGELKSSKVRILIPGFPLSFDIKIQGSFKDFQGPSNFIFKDQFSTEVYSMSSRTAIFNVYLCDDGTEIR